MERKESSFQLWSPPTLDLSLDSFSTDILSRFGKQEAKSPMAELKRNSQVVDSAESLDFSPVESSQPSVLYESRMSSPAYRGETPSLVEGGEDEEEERLEEELEEDEEQEENEEEIKGDEQQSMSDMFRRSSTALKSSRISSHRGSVEISPDSTISVTSVDKSRSSFVPKSLECSPVMEHPCDTIEADQQSVISSLHIKEPKQDHQVFQAETESLAVSQPIENKGQVSVPEVSNAPERGASTSTQPKRRSIFFFRFC
ncbi:hypothetical protein BY458DRAFT_550380 [Sporodiniella umbellata]|nr:hypothetical protein BY458DRAFT_550380 [Sporodiniella umbellata]